MPATSWLAPSGTGASAGRGRTCKGEIHSHTDYVVPSVTSRKGTFTGIQWSRVFSCWLLCCYCNCLLKERSIRMGNQIRFQQNLREQVDGRPSECLPINTFPIRIRQSAAGDFTEIIRYQHLYWMLQGRGRINKCRNLRMSQ